MKPASLLLLALLAGCGYRAPGAEADTTAYRTDFETCESSAVTQVNTKNAKRALDWFSSPVRRWGQIGDATGACMQAKGHGAVRWCTADELRGGTRSGTRIVTAAGIQCVDPPRAATP